MKEIVRPLDLKSKNGEFLLEKENTEYLRRESIVMIEILTKDKSDAEFIEWLRNYRDNGLSHVDSYNIENEIQVNKVFSNIQGKLSNLNIGISIVMQLLIEINDLLVKEKEPVHLIEDVK